MAHRKGLGTGRGKGFKNIIGQDPRTHSNNARGIKSSVPLKPQKPQTIKDTRLMGLSSKFDWIDEKDLKEFEKEIGSEIEGVEDSFYDGDLVQIQAEDGTEWIIARSDDEAERIAKDQVKEQLEDEPELFNQDWLLGIIDTDKAEDFFRDVYDEQNRNYVEDIESESDNEFPNRLRDEMVERNLITEKEAKDEEFDIEDKKDDFVEQMTQESIDEGNGGYDYYAFNFGDEEAKKLLLDNNLIDIDEATDDAIATDGWQHFLARYDGNSTELDSGKIIWREN